MQTAAHPLYPAVTCQHHVNHLGGHQAWGWKCVHPKTVITLDLCWGIDICWIKSPLLALLFKFFHHFLGSLRNLPVHEGSVPNHVFLVTVFIQRLSAPSIYVEDSIHVEWYHFYHQCSSSSSRISWAVYVNYWYTKGQFPNHFTLTNLQVPASSHGLDVKESCSYLALRCEFHAMRAKKCFDIFHFPPPASFSSSRGGLKSVAFTRPFNSYRSGLPPSSFSPFWSIVLQSESSTPLLLNLTDL